VLSGSEACFLFVMDAPHHGISGMATGYRVRLFSSSNVWHRFINHGAAHVFLPEGKSCLPDLSDFFHADHGILL